MISFGRSSWGLARRNLTFFQKWTPNYYSPQGLGKKYEIRFEENGKLNECFSFIMFLAATMGIMGSKLLIFHLFDIFPVTVLLLLPDLGRGRGEGGC